MKFPIPKSAFDDRVSIVGMSGSGRVQIKTRVSDPKNKGEPRLCAFCGDLFAPHRKNKGAKYCSKSCVWRAERGPEFNAKIARETAVKRGNAQRGKGEGKTYRKLNGRHEHRVVAESKLGRSLQKGEIVHHADEVKTNNSPANLINLPNQAEHARLHFSGKKQSADHIRKRIESRAKTMASRKQAREVLA